MEFENAVAEVDELLIGLLEEIKQLEPGADTSDLIDRLSSLSNSDSSKLLNMKVPDVNEGRLAVLGHLCVKKPCPEQVLVFLVKKLQRDEVYLFFDGHRIPFLHLAVYCGNGSAVQVLRQLRRIFWASDSSKRNVLHMAAKSGDTRIARYIIECVHSDGTNRVRELLNGKDDLEMTPLHYAVWEDDESMTDTVMSLVGVNFGHINLNAADKFGLTALHVASLNSHMGILCTLLKHREIDVNAADINGLTALHIAPWKNHAEVVCKLLDHPDINVNATDKKNGLTAFDYIGVPRELLDARPLQPIFMFVAPTLPGDSVLRSLPAELEGMESQLLQLCIDRENALEKINEERRRRTAIPHFNELTKTVPGPEGNVSSEGQQEEPTEYTMRRRAVQLLFPDYDFRDSGKLTALHRAEWQGHSLVVATLSHNISRKARARPTLNALDKNGMTALHYAVIRGDASIVEDLLSNSMVRGNVREERRGLTPLNMVYQLVKGEHLLFSKKKREIVEEYRVIIDLLSEQPDVKFYVESLYRDRQLFVDAANAILVGAALIASITFAGWLQPPLGFQQYYETSLSFFFAMATALVGACVVLPNLEKAELEAHVKRMRGLHIWTTLFLGFSVLFVLGAFIAAGFASLPPTLEYQWCMISTTGVGGLVGLGALCYYLLRVITLTKLIWKDSEYEHRVWIAWKLKAIWMGLRKAIPRLPAACSK
ncbi:unnamed protein product [Calypogeia fissa]